MFCDYFLPSQKAGGPAKSVQAIVEALNPRACSLIVTRDRDRGDSVPYSGILPDRLRRGYGARIFYASPGWRRTPRTVTLLRRLRPRIVYLNSFFSPHFSLLVLLLMRLRIAPRAPRVVLAPRGELAPSALAIKPRRKRMALWISRLTGLHEGLVWHAASAVERADIESALGRHLPRCALDAQVLEAPPPGDGRARTARVPAKTAGSLRLVYLSRISRVKNLHLALAALAAVRGHVVFDIYGAYVRPEDRAYWRECQALIERLPETVAVTYRGAVPRDDVVQTLSDYHVFVLPSAGENYGHAVVEALSAGCLVCLSDRTPWRGLEQAGIGWDVTLDQPAALSAALQDAVDMDGDEFAARQGAIARYVARHLDRDSQVRANLRLFGLQTGPGGPMDTVET